MFSSYSGDHEQLPGIENYENNASDDHHMPNSFSREVKREDNKVPISIMSSKRNIANSSVAEKEHNFQRRRSASTSRLSSSSSSRNALNRGSRGSGLNRGSIRKAKLSTDRDNGAISKQGLLISQDSIERVINERHNSP